MTLERPASLKFDAGQGLGGFGGIWIVVRGKTRRREVVDAATFYWHFLGVLWVALFFVLAH